MTILGPTVAGDAVLACVMSEYARYRDSLGRQLTAGWHEDCWWTMSSDWYWKVWASPGIAARCLMSAPFRQGGREELIGIPVMVMGYYGEPRLTRYPGGEFTTRRLAPEELMTR